MCGSLAAPTARQVSVSTPAGLRGLGAVAMRLLINHECLWCSVTFAHECPISYTFSETSSYKTTGDRHEELGVRTPVCLSVWVRDRMYRVVFLTDLKYKEKDPVFSLNRNEFQVLLWLSFVFVFSWSDNNGEFLAWCLAHSTQKHLLKKWIFNWMCFLLSKCVYSRKLEIT